LFKAHFKKKTMESLSSMLAKVRLEEQSRKITILQRPPEADRPPENEASSAPVTASAASTSPSAAASTTTAAAAAASTAKTPTQTDASKSKDAPATPPSTSSPSPSLVDPKSDQNTLRKKWLEDQKEILVKKSIAENMATMGYPDPRGQSDDWGLMEADWLKTIPPNFEKDWIVVPVPNGKRSSLWCLDGETHAYTKRGQFLSRFQTYLPNGFHYSYDEGSTFLDCIFDEKLSTYFVIDGLQWQDQDMREWPARDRFRCINDKMDEVAAYGAELHPRVRNQISQFVLQLPIFPCTPLGLSKALAWTPLPNLKLTIDGILFFHNDGFYTSGRTPLVAWIKPWMAADIFANVKVPPAILACKPFGYKDLTTYMKEWDDKEARNRNKAAERRGKAKVPKVPTGPGSTPRLFPDIPIDKVAQVIAARRLTDDQLRQLPALPDDGEDEKDEGETNEPVIDKFDVLKIAEDAKASDNDLLRLIGDNIVDTFIGTHQEEVAAPETAQVAGESPGPTVWVPEFLRRR